MRARSGRTFEAVVHRSADVVIVELEDAIDERNAFHLQLQRSVARLHNAETPDELCRIAVREVRALTGFDRGMAYRFDDEWNGGIHRSEGRAAFDVLGPAIAGFGRPSAGPRSQAPLDPSFSVLRSVSERLRAGRAQRITIT